MSQCNEGRSVSRLERCITAVLRICQDIGIATIVVMMLVTVVHAVGRYVFAHPVPGLIEVSCFMLITAVFLVGGYTAMVKGHVTIGLIVDRFSERTQAIVDSFTYILCLVVAILALWQSFAHGIYIMESGVTSSILRIPRFPFIYVVGVGWGLFSLAILIHLVHFLPRVVKKWIRSS